MVELICPVCQCEFFTPDADETDEIEGLKIRCPDCRNKSQVIGFRLIPFAKIDYDDVVIELEYA
jgi:DNA-directed RNA polymerase subunit RPC12/RpoP